MQGNELSDVRRHHTDALACTKEQSKTLSSSSCAFVIAQGNELSDVRRHHNDALARIKEQSEALLHALGRGKHGGADEDAVSQVGMQAWCRCVCVWAGWVRGCACGVRKRSCGE